MLGIGPASVQQMLTVYVLVLAAIGLASLTRVARAASDVPPSSAFDAALQVRIVQPMRPPELVRTEREITLGIASSGQLYRRLLPMLREAAAARLSAGHNIELERRPEAARALLGDETWEHLAPGPAGAGRPQRPRHPDVGSSRSVIATLEKL